MASAKANRELPSDRIQTPVGGPPGWDDLPQEIRRRYERNLTGSQINDLRSNLPFDFLRNTDPDRIIKRIGWFQLQRTERLMNAAMTLLSSGEGYIRFDDALPFDRNLWGGSDQMIDAARALVSLLDNPSNPGPGGIGSKRKHANILISNLYRIRSITCNTCIWYFRDRNRYTHIERYHCLRFNRDTLAWLVGRLGEIGFIEHYPGFQNRETGESRASRMRATWRFALWLEEIHGISQSMIGPYKDFRPDPIQLRDRTKAPIDYSDTAVTRRMRRDLRAYNQLLSRSNISIPLDNPDVQREIRTSAIDMSTNYYRRVFNNGSFELGGRYYGPWWQRLSSDMRRLITINGNPTSELDYGSMNVHLLCSMEGERYADHYQDGDPYLLDDYGQHSRDTLKQILLIALNTGNEAEALGAIRMDLRDREFSISNSEIRSLIDQFRIKHQVISQKLYSGVGLQLQYTESQVSSYVIKVMTENSIPILNIHDGYIVENRYAPDLMDIMEEAFQSNGLSSVPVIRQD